MATRKPDAEVGPIGVWAYSARTSLKGSDGGELQPEEVAPLLPKPPHPATIRRIESNPTYNPEKMVRDLYVIYRRMGEEQGVFVPPPPLGQSSSTPTDQSALINALDRQSQVMEALVILLARREGISLDELAAEEGSMLRKLGRLLQDDLRTATNEAIARGQNPGPEAPQPLDRKRLPPLPAKP